jgi:hypothetical protein
MKFHHVWLGRNIKLQQTSCVSIAMPQKFSTDPDLLGYLCFWLKYIIFFLQLSHLYRDELVLQSNLSMQSPVLKGHHFTVLSEKISYEFNLF